METLELANSINKLATNQGLVANEGKQWKI